MKQKIGKFEWGALCPNQILSFFAKLLALETQLQDAEVA